MLINDRPWEKTNKYIFKLKSIDQAMIRWLKRLCWVIMTSAWKTDDVIGSQNNNPFFSELFSSEIFQQLYNFFYNNGARSKMPPADWSKLEPT